MHISVCVCVCVCLHAGKGPLPPDGAALCLTDREHERILLLETSCPPSAPQKMLHYAVA